MQNCSLRARIEKIAPLLVMVCLAYSGASAQAQQPVPAQDRSYRKTYSPVPTTAIPQQRSRAEREAESLVSLSAERIIGLLTDEPGLMLECKKVLVRVAYEQGRLLDPSDLDDDAVYRLVRLDRHVRALFTREISSRYYIRAKPTREELEQDQQDGLVRVPVPGATPPANVANASQEEQYWLRHEQEQPVPQVIPGGTSTAPATPGQTAPQVPPYPPEANPETPSYDPRRAMLLAQQGEPLDSLDSSSGAGLMQRISPDQLPGLLDASMTGGTGTGNLSLGGDRGLMNPGGMGSSALSGNLPLSSSLADLQWGSSGQAASGTRYPDFMSRRTIYPKVPERITQPLLRRKPNPYADVPSLYDMYSQYARRSPVLERFGADVFENGTGNFEELPMDMPVGPDYVVGPGDSLSIDLTGSISQRLRRAVDRQGRVALPEAGAVQVAGKTLGEVQHLVQGVLRTQFRDVQADVSLSRLRTVRVYVVGDVQRPGAYDVSSLSTPLNAAYQAGGPTSRGSLRILQHYRGKQLIEEVDVYDLLLHGVRAGVQRLEAGDTVLVPPLGPEITVQGMVRRPAIYEVKGEKSLAEVLELAGGVLPSGTLRHVDVERLVSHESRSMLRLDIPESNNGATVTKALEDFQVQAGDKIQISPILPYADKTVYLEGHVFRPGKFAYRDGMKITDLIQSYKDLLPEPYQQHAEIIRLKEPDHTPEVLAFNLADALSGKNPDMALKPFDTVRVFGRFDFEDPPVITITGEVRDPGDHITNGATSLRDAIFLAGNTTPEAQLDDVQVFRKTDDGKLKVLSFDFSKALVGDATQNVVLLPKDRVFVHKNLAKVDPPSVTIAGEVARPGKYPLGDGMTAAGLVRFAGGLKRSAYKPEADLTRYTEESGNKVIGERQTVQIAKALGGEADTDVRLRDGDVLTIRQVAGWNDIGATITVQGEVVHPGTYGIQEGEKLSSIIARAGGFRSNAYPYGAVFERLQVQQMEEKNRSDLIRRIRSESADLKLAPDNPAADIAAKNAALMQYQTTLEKLQNTPPAGRMVVHISPKIEKWANSTADIQVRAGDVLYIPKKPGLVMVDGAVYNPTGVTYKPGKSAGWYLRQAGGPTQLANKKGVFVIRADGSVVGGSGGMFSGGAESAELRPGDMVVVPERVFSYTSRWKNVLESAQLAYSVGVAIQVARSF